MRFFFHVFNGRWDFDNEGSEFSSVEDALAMARGIRRELLLDPEGGWEQARIVVADVDGELAGVMSVADLRLH
jgi:hypothetical protein